MIQIDMGILLILTHNNIKIIIMIWNFIYNQVILNLNSIQMNVLSMKRITTLKFLIFILIKLVVNKIFNKQKVNMKIIMNLKMKKNMTVKLIIALQLNLYHKRVYLLSVLREWKVVYVLQLKEVMIPNHYILNR